MVIGSSQAHLIHVSTLSGPGRARIRPVVRDGQRRRWPPVPVSCCLSAAGLGFLDHPVPAGELGLPYGRLTEEGTSGPHRGYHVPRERDTTGVGAPFTPGRRCSPGWQRIPNRRLPLLSGESCTPLEHPICGAKDHEASSGVQSPSPVRSSPCLWSADGTQALGLLPRAPHRAVTGNARRGGDWP